MVKTLPIARAHADDAARLDPARIGGISSAIALHLIVFGLLMMPAQVPMDMTPEESRTRYEPVIRTPPPPPPPPIEVDVVKKPSITPKPHPALTPPRETVRVPDAASSSTTSVTVDEAPVIADHGESLPPRGDEGGPSSGGEPMAGVALQYLRNPAPAYPRDALREGLEGTVLLRVLVDEAGRPVEVSIATGSGHRTLDRAAREQVLRHWTFVPAQRNGRPVRAIGTVPVAFRIDR